jgi:hypothetical protein
MPIRRPPEVPHQKFLWPCDKIPSLKNNNNTRHLRFRQDAEQQTQQSAKAHYKKEGQKRKPARKQPRHEAPASRQRPRRQAQPPGSNQGKAESALL